MPTASILTKTSGQTVSSGSTTTIDVTWQTETKYLDADVDFFDSGVDDTRLNIPSSVDGELYEVYLWVEDTTNYWGTGNGGYFGLRSVGAETPEFLAWRIVRDIGRPSGGSRSGMVVADSDGADWYTSGREFQSDTMTFGTRCRMGILLGNPVPIAMAAGTESGFSTATSNTVLDLDEDYDIGDCYDPSTGIYTAPTGAEVCVCNCNGYVVSATSGSTFEYTLEIEGTEEAKFEHDGSLRGKGPGTFGIFPITAGDEVVFKHLDNGGVRTGEFYHSVEFY